jgi:dimethylglycine dehydrogenase
MGMAEFAQAKVVIIGGGAVGVSSLYHLAKAGWTDVLLLEKNELTAGSTWHAAGNVPTFSSSWSIMNMQRYSAELYRGLGEAVNYPMNYHVTGSVRLGHTEERLMEFQKVAGMGRYQGMDLQVLTPDEIKTRYPFVETHDLTGALYDPYDGDIDPAQLTQALATGARQMGARIERFCPVTAARWTGSEWILSTPKGEVRAEYVVNSGGYYAAEVGKLFNRRVPMMVMSHQYMLFDTIPELESWTKEVGHKLPLLRDVDSSYYLRQEKMGFNLGPYEGNCRAHWATPDDPMPEDFSFQLYPDDLDRLEWHINDAMARVPLLAKANLTKVINGPIPYTRMATRCWARCRASRTPSRPASSPSAFVRPAARARCWRNGSPKARPNGTCGPATRAGSPAGRITTIASRRGWKSMATNTPCTSRTTPGPMAG